MIKEVDSNIIKNHWNDLIKVFQNANFYQSYENYLINSFGNKKCKLYVEYNSNNKPIIAAMIVIYENTITIPFGPVFDSTITENQLLSFLYYIKNIYKLPLEFCLNYDDKKNFSKITSSYNEIWDFSTIILELNDIEYLKSNFNTNRKRIIKKCLIELKNTIITTNPNNAKIFYEMYCNRLAETNGTVDFTYEELVHMLSIPNVTLHLCQRGTDNLAGIITYSFNDTLINRYNCTNSNFLHLNPNSYLDYSLIKDASKSDKFKYYDFSGFVLGDNLSTKTFNLNRYKLSYGPKKIKSYKWYNI